MKGGRIELGSKGKDHRDHLFMTHVTDEETEAQRGKATCPRSYPSRIRLKLGFLEFHFYMLIGLCLHYLWLWLFLNYNGRIE